MGYCLPFLSTPPLSNVLIPLPSYSPTSIKGAALEEVTLGLIAKGAVELAPLPSPGFYSRLFVVWKTSGSWRPVIDLSHLNRFVDVSHFQWLTFARRVAPGLLSSTPWLRRSCAGRSPSPYAWLHSSFRAPTTS